jgi:hypothetical protein
MANENRLIYKEPIKQFIQYGLNNPDHTKAFGYDAIQILAEIEFAPTVDAVEVVHGKWLPQKLLGERVWDCSECKTLGSPQWKFCPVCGAKMDGGNEDG